MLEELFEEIAQKVVAKLEQAGLPLQHDMELQSIYDNAKIQHLIEQAKKEEDIYSKWFIDEINQVNNSNDIDRVYLMSEIVAYLAFWSQYPPPKEIQDLKPFEIFYNVYIAALKIKNLKPLGVIQET